jgi:hypothetical protein
MVQRLVEGWWRPNRKRISTDLGKMSKEQLQVVVDRLLPQVRRELRDYRYDDPAQRVSALLSSLLDREEHGRRSWWDQDLHPAMLPLLLAETGYEEKPAAKTPGRETSAISYAAVPLLAALRKNAEAPSLHRLAADNRQNSATRLTCLLALYRAGEELNSASVLPILNAEKKLERRLVAILALGHCRDAKAVSPQLIKLLDDPNVYVRGAAVQALHNGKPAEALPKLKKLLDSGDRREAVYAILSLLGEMKTREARTILADFLAQTLGGGRRSHYLLHALLAFEQATGKSWIEAGAHPETYYRSKARVALEWWKKQKE